MHRHIKKYWGLDQYWYTIILSFYIPSYSKFSVTVLMFFLFFFSTKRAQILLTKKHWFILPPYIKKKEVLFPYPHPGSWKVFFSPALFLQVNAATKVPKRFEMSEWRERQEGTGPPRPLDSPSSSVQWTDRHWRWEPIPPVVPEEPAPPVVLLWERSTSERKTQGEKIQYVDVTITFC